MIVNVNLFPYSALVKYFSKAYLQTMPSNQPVLLDNSGEKELDLLIYEAGFRKKEDSLPKIHVREKKSLYELLIETNIFDPEWRGGENPSEKEENSEVGLEDTGTVLEDTIHKSTRYLQQFSYLSFRSKNEQNLFLEDYNSMKSLECQKLGDARFLLTFEKIGNSRTLYRCGSTVMAALNVIPLVYIISQGFDIPLALAGTGLTLGAVAFRIAGDYSHRKRVANAETELKKVTERIKQSRFAIEQYRPITLLNKEALEKALEIK